MAHKFAIENDLILADMIEVTEFPYLANKYRIMGVPLTVINEKRLIEGAMPEDRFVDEVLAALEPRQMSG